MAEAGVRTHGGSVGVLLRSVNGHLCNRIICARKLELHMIRIHMKPVRCQTTDTHTHTWVSVDAVTHIFK